MIKYFLWLQLFVGIHPFYVSMVDINHNAADKTVEISIRIFRDDIENTLKNFSGQPIDVINPKNKEVTDKYLLAYLQKHLQLTVNDKAFVYDYLGYEIIKESIWIYVEIPNIDTLKKIGVTCSLLHDFNSQQINIIHVKKQQQEKSYKLDFPNSYVSFGF